LFLEDLDITLKRFEETTGICGNIPRECFELAVSPETLSIAKTIVLNGIMGNKDMAGAMFGRTGDLTQSAFEIYTLPRTGCGSAA
jgi:hypothetical protein